MLSMGQRVKCVTLAEPIQRFPNDRQMVLGLVMLSERLDKSGRFHQQQSITRFLTYPTVRMVFDD